MQSLDNPLRRVFQLQLGSEDITDTYRDEFVAIGTREGKVIIWDVETENSREVGELSGSIGSVHFTDNGRYLLAESKNEGGVWEVASYEPLFLGTPSDVLENDITGGNDKT